MAGQNWRLTIMPAVGPGGGLEAPTARENRTRWVNMTH